MAIRISWVRVSYAGRELVWLLGMYGQTYEQLTARAYRIGNSIVHPPCPTCGKPQ